MKRQEVGIPQEAKLAMMISRMISWKTDLVSAMKFLPQYVHLALVGWGLLENELKNKPARKGLPREFIFRRS